MGCLLSCDKLHRRRMWIIWPKNYKILNQSLNLHHHSTKNIKIMCSTDLKKPKQQPEISFIFNKNIHTDVLYIVLLRLWQWAFCLKKISFQREQEISKDPSFQISPRRMQHYFEWSLIKSALNSLVPTIFEKSSIVCSCLHHPTFDQQKWLYCWCRFLSYCLIVFNKESIGTNYMVLRLVIDKALRLMMWEKLGLCLCVWKVSDGVFGTWSVYKNACGCVRFPPCSLNGSDFLNPSTMMDSWKWKRAVLI